MLLNVIHLAWNVAKNSTKKIHTKYFCLICKENIFATSGRIHTVCMHVYTVCMMHAMKSDMHYLGYGKSAHEKVTIKFHS